ncbi:MAG: hypothetical protein WDZ59_02410 [Pirellulales bacterium]
MIDRPLRGRTYSLRAAICAAMLLVAAAAPAVYAQPPYETVPFDPNVLGQHRFQVSRIMGMPSLSDADRQVLREYLELYVFGKMAQTDPRNLGELAEDRLAFQNTLLDRAENGPVRNELNRLTAGKMREFVEKNFHPATRYNAALILANIDQTKAPDFRTPPVPLPDATRYLLSGILMADQFQSGRPVDDYLKAAALVGLQRHAKLNIPDATKSELSSAAVQLLSQSDPPGDRSAAAHLWMRRQAVEILAALGQPGTGNAAYNALLSAVNEQSSPLWFRQAAASAIGRLTFPQDAGLDGAALAAALGRLAVAACDAEAAPAGQTPDQLSDQMLVTRRRLGAGLHSVQQGLAAAAKLAPQNQDISKLQQPTTQLLETLTDTTTDDATIAPQIAQKRSQLQSALSSLQPAGAAGATSQAGANTSATGGVN